MIHRIFLAINLPKQVKAQLLEYKQQWLKLPAKWSKPDNLHVTLAFLGNTSDKELEQVKKATREVAARHKPFSFALSKIVYGPTAKQPKMIWAKGETPKELLLLQKDLANALRYQEERPFSLHITLARLREWEFRTIEPEERPEINEEISLEIPVSSVELMESKMKREGAKYSVIESRPL